MKICLLADARSAHIRQFTHHLAARGHTIHVVTHKPADLPGATVERFTVPPPGISNPRRWEARRRRYLQDIFRQFDVVNVHFLADWGLEKVLEERGPDDARIVATAWGSDIVDPPGETPACVELTEARKRLLRGADAVTTCGPTFARTVAAYAGIPLDAISVMPFGVDLSLFNPAHHSGFQTETVVGFFKGFRPVYGATTLIRAIPLVLAQCPNARFEMIGDGVELARCQELALESDVRQAIAWLGRLEHHLLPQRLHRWRLSVIPSIHEAFGVAALESQAMRIPVVASRVCGLADTVRDRETGLLFPVGDHEALANAITQLLTNESQLPRMGLSGHAMVRRYFDWRHVAVQWEQLYQRVCERAVCPA